MKERKFKCKNCGKIVIEDQKEFHYNTCPETKLKKFVENSSDISGGYNFADYFNKGKK